MNAFRMQNGRVLERWFQPGVWGLFLFVALFSLINPLQSADTNQNLTTGSNESMPSFVNHDDLTKKQKDRVVTVEFNLTNINRTNETALRIIYREMRRAIVAYLNRKKVTSIRPSTTVVPTTVETTTPVPTTVKTTTAVPTTVEPTTAVPTTVNTSHKEPIERRKKRNEDDNDDYYKEEHFPFIKVINDIEGGILRISLFINRTGDDELTTDLLYDAAVHLKNDNTLQRVTGAPVVNVYKGMPPYRAEVPQALADYRVWLPILFIIVLLAVIVIFVICWTSKDKKVQNKNLRATENNKIELEPTKVNPQEASNGHTVAPTRHAPLLLDDDCGWMVPINQLTNDTR